MGVRLRACQGVEGPLFESCPPHPSCSTGAASSVVGHAPVSHQLGGRTGGLSTPGVSLGGGVVVVWLRL